MTRHFGVLIPSTNTTTETEYSRLLPPECQAHFARMLTGSSDKTPFGPPRDEDLDYQAKLLGTAKVETVFLLQTSASLGSDGLRRRCRAPDEPGSGLPGLYLGTGGRPRRAGARGETDRPGVALFGGGQ